MKSLSPQRKAMLQMILCASLWSIAGIFIKQIPWNPLVIAGARSLISGIFIFIYLKIKRVRFQFTRSAVISAVLMCCTFVAFVTANKLTTAANAIVLQFTAPVFLLIFSALIFHQKLRRADGIAVFVTLLGIALFFFDQLTPGHLLGNCVAILAGAFMAAMYLAVGNSSPESRLCGMLMGHLLTAIVGLPAAFFSPTPVTGIAVLNIVILGVFQLGLPYLLFALAVEHCPPLACSLLGALEPLLNPIWVFLFDGEAPGIFALFGGVVVIAAVTVWCIWWDKQAAKDGLAEPSAPSTPPAPSA